MYKLQEFNGEVVAIKRVSDAVSIPMISDNTDYQTYLAWLAEGNTPEPADTP